MSDWVSEIEFERLSLVRRVLRMLLVNPAANYLPAGLLRGMLRLTRSELAAANWRDPGGWRSMVISYEGAGRQIADRILVGGGTMAMALRNRKRLAAGLLARLIDSASGDPVHVLCLGAGPGYVITEAMGRARRASRATLVDLSSEAFDWGRALADRLGLTDRMTFVQGDVRQIAPMLDGSPDVVKMLGICEYLTDEQIVGIGRAMAGILPSGGPILLNSLSPAHGTDRFFRRVLGLHMNHRSPDAVKALMERAGFGDFVSIPEPLGVYHVIVGRRCQ